jgi:hypothetical protein
MQRFMCNIHSRQGSDPEAAGATSGILFNHGKHCKEVRTFMLHNLGDFGIGKPRLESLLHEEVSKLCNYLDKFTGACTVIIGIYTILGICM